MEIPCGDLKLVVGELRVRVDDKEGRVPEFWIIRHLNAVRPGFQGLLDLHKQFIYAEYAMGFDAQRLAGGEADGRLDHAVVNGHLYWRDLLWQAFARAMKSELISC